MRYIESTLMKIYLKNILIEIYLNYQQKCQKKKRLMNKILFTEFAKQDVLQDFFNNYISYFMNGLITEILFKLVLKYMNNLNIIVVYKTDKWFLINLLHYNIVCET